MLQREARKGMGDDEAQFSVEQALDSQVYLWSDKYRPRKPRYFNRVHTGFEWNKYNQTHYDMDNPPPKIVQGYKFNIFYPDLIDKTSTPEYFLVGNFALNANKFIYFFVCRHLAPKTVNSLYSDSTQDRLTRISHSKLSTANGSIRTREDFVVNFTITYSSCGFTSNATDTEDNFYICIK